MKKINALNEKTDPSDLPEPLSILPQEARSELKAAQKIIAFENIAEALAPFRAEKIIAQCHGVFDLLHIGHIKHLHHAKGFGDILIVSLTADKFVNKGPGRPYFSEYLRAEALAALECVDYVVINHHPTAIEAIEVIRPNFYVKGVEYQDAEKDITGKLAKKKLPLNRSAGD